MNCSVIFGSRDKEIDLFLVLGIALVILTAMTTLLVTCKFTRHGGVAVRQVQVKRNLQGVRKLLTSQKSQQLLHRQILSMCSVKSHGGDSRYPLSFVLFILLLLFPHNTFCAFAFVFCLLLYFWELFSQSQFNIVNLIYCRAYTELQLEFSSESYDCFFNPSRPSSGQREKINLNFHFHISLWCLKRFYEGLKGLLKPQKEVGKYTIVLIFIFILLSMLVYRKKSNKRPRRLIIF